jgi:hypothetical protein
LLHLDLASSGGSLDCTSLLDTEHTSVSFCGSLHRKSLTGNVSIGYIASQLDQARSSCIRQTISLVGKQHSTQLISRSPRNTHRWDNLRLWPSSTIYSLSCRVLMCTLWDNQSNLDHSPLGTCQQDILCMHTTLHLQLAHIVQGNTLQPKLG